MPDLQSLQDTPRILVVEDSHEDFEVLKRAFQKLNFHPKIHRCSDGDEALDLCFSLVRDDGNLSTYDREAEDEAFKNFGCPDLILLDLNLPGTDGREAIAELKAHPQLKIIPIVVFTTSSSPQDILTCYQNGANAYTIKPIRQADLLKTLENTIRFWLNTVISPRPSLKSHPS